MTTDHSVEKLGTKVMNSLDWTVQANVDARISTEALLQPDAVAVFSVERGKDESLRQNTTRRLAQIEAASAAALVTMPTTTWGTVLKEGARLTRQSEQNLSALFEWQHGARRRCESTQHVGRGKSGRHHQGSCESCGALLHGNWKIQ